MRLFLCYIFPPLAVLLMGRPFSAVLNIFLTVFGLWRGGVNHALVCYADWRGNNHAKRLASATDNPEWAKRAHGEPEKKPPGVMRRAAGAFAAPFAEAIREGAAAGQIDGERRGREYLLKRQAEGKPIPEQYRYLIEDKVASPDDATVGTKGTQHKRRSVA